MELFSTFIIELAILAFIIVRYGVSLNLTFLLSGYIVTVMTVLQLLCVLCQFRFFTYVIYADGIFNAFFFRKLLCAVDGRKLPV